MPIIETKSLTPELVKRLHPQDARQLYNGLDCCLTFEIFEKVNEILEGKNTPSAKLIYNFERAMQAPALDMMLRGFLIDQHERKKAEEIVNKKISRVQQILNRFSNAYWHKDLNANSPLQLKNFFYYHNEGMRIPPVELSFKGVRRVTTNREALEKIADQYFYAVPIVNCILLLRDLKKQLSILTTEISPDGRFRSSYNVAGTSSGRWSSSASVFDDGSNLQNISVKLRKPFVADPGYKLLHLDLEQAESKAVGLLVWATVGDGTYLDASMSGDLHTAVAIDLWPDKVHDKDSAEALFYRHFSYRDMSKRGGHASNYRVTPPTMSRHLKIPREIAQAFQEVYFGKFSGIRKWHTWVGKQLNLYSELTTPLGRERTFFGRPDDDTTLREAIAYEPQSMVADALNLILWRIWDAGLPLQLLTQEHDGFTFQFPDDPKLETELAHKVRELAKVLITKSNETALIETGGRVKPETKTLIIPCDISVGWNWAPGDKPPFIERLPNGTVRQLNPNGLMKWKGQPDGRKRLTGLDRIIS